MILRIKVPQPLFLYEWNDERLGNLSVSFHYRCYAVTLSIEGGTVEKATWAKPEDSCRWYRKATEFVLTIAETERSSPRLAGLIAAPQHEELLKLLEGVTLKVLQVVRSIGIVPELPESLPREESLEEELRAWNPETSDDGVTWAPVFAPELAQKHRTILGALMGLGPRKQGFAMNAELNASYWDRISEVLEDNLEIPPEDEFLTNTIGHLRGRNYRLAVVDSVIGLEIVLTRYLKAYLSISKNIPNPRIKAFLRHDFGMTARLSAILDLTVHESWLKDINMDHVLKAVDWRNRIVHRTGRLPQDIPTEVKREVINAVLALARTLAELYIHEMALKDRKKISEAMRNSWEGRIYWPNIWIKPWHRVTVEIECFGTPLSGDEMQRIAEELGTHLKARDPRFELATHLFVSYHHGFPRERIGDYLVGRVLLKGESLLDIPPRATVSGKASAGTEPGTPEPSTSPTTNQEGAG